MNGEQPCPQSNIKKIALALHDCVGNFYLIWFVKCNVVQKTDKLQPYRVFLYTKWSIVIANINKFLIQNTSRGRSSRLQMIFKIDVLKDFAIFTGKHLCWSLFLIMLQVLRSATLSERDSITGVYWWWILPHV